METENKKRKREWVKTAAIIFLAVLLVLTLFSQTILNRSLPEVATQGVQSGTINAKIRGSGTVSANETYDVTLSQTRKIKSVLVKQGQEVAAGDVLFILEEGESEEVKSAQEALDAEKNSYERMLIERANSAATDNRQVQLARDKYNTALSKYKSYTTLDPSQLTSQITTAEAQLRAMKQGLEDANRALEKAKTASEYVSAQEAVSTCQSKIDSLTAEIESYDKQLEELIASGTPSTVDIDRQIADKAGELTAANSTLSRDKIIYDTAYQALKTLASSDPALMAAYAKDTALLMAADPSLSEDDAKFMATAYDVITTDNNNISSINEQLTRLREDRESMISAADTTEAQRVVREKKAKAQTQLNANQSQLAAAQNVVTGYEMTINSMELAVQAAQDAVDTAQSELTNLQSASDAASEVTAAEEALEELLFQQSLGDTEDIDLREAKERLAKLQKELDEVKLVFDEAEVKSNVPGVVGTIYVTAGNTVGAEMPLASINVTGRGYTIEIPVTNAQAKQVRLGDTADVTNYYWGNNIEATLEAIKNDPANPGSGKLLSFKLTGDIEPGVNISLSIGQKSANYEALVPNSAVRNDANGSFVLVVQSKPSPLGNRYTATRVDVTVLASDDTLSAVTGLSMGDFVITTSTKPIEPGAQIRLVEN